MDRDFLDELTDNAGSVELYGIKVRFRLPDAPEIGRVKQVANVTEKEQNEFLGGPAMWTFMFAGHCLAASVIPDENVRERTPDEWTRVVYNEHIEHHEKAGDIVMPPIASMAIHVCGFRNIDNLDDPSINNNLDKAKKEIGDVPT